VSIGVDQKHTNNSLQLVKGAGKGEKVTLKKENPSTGEAAAVFRGSTQSKGGICQTSEEGIRVEQG